MDGRLRVQAKKESRIDVPAPTEPLPAMGLYGRTPPLSELDRWSDTDDCTAAKTMRAKLTPVVAPRYRRLEAPPAPPTCPSC